MISALLMMHLFFSGVNDRRGPAKKKKKKKKKKE
jgi:hypothetical protein